MELSIITINKNNAEGLRRTMQSVLEQTVRDQIEYIVIDGASIDNSVEVIRTLADDETIWISEPDNGIYNAMNKGIRIAHGEYLLFLNSGDRLIDNHAIKRILSLDLQSDICYGYQYDKTNEGLRPEICIDEAYITFDSMRNAHIPHQSSLIKRNTIVALGGYDEEYKIVSDWAYVMKCLFQHNGTIRRIPIYISIYDTAGISSNPDKTEQWQERRNFLQKEFPRILPDYERWDRLNQTSYMRIIKQLRNWKHRLIRP